MSDPQVIILGIIKLTLVITIILSLSRLTTGLLFVGVRYLQSNRPAAYAWINVRGPVQITLGLFLMAVQTVLVGLPALWLMFYLFGA